MDLGTIPTIGWLVIAFIAILIFIVLVYLLRKGLKLGIGDKSLSVGQTKEVNEKLDELKSEISEKEQARLHDEELRKCLFRKSGLIDEKEKADERRVIRGISQDVRNIFQEHVKCEMPLLSVVEGIKDVLQERVDYNNMREKLTSREKAGYIDDVLYQMQKSYERFLHRVPNVPCSQEKYPEWFEVKPALQKLVDEWAIEMIRIMEARINEKISMYEEKRDGFVLDEYKSLCCDFPIDKNKRYIKELNARVLQLV